MAPKEITDFTGFRTSIRLLFEVLQNAYDKDKMQEVLQNDEKFSKVDRETVIYLKVMLDVLLILLKMKLIIFVEIILVKK